MEQDASSILISQINGLNSFQDFWSINNSSITLADFHVFQARYKTIDFTSSRDGKFTFLETFTEEDISIIKNHRIPFITNSLIKGLYCDVLATILGKGAFVQAEESIRCYLEVLSNYSRYDQRMILGVLIGCTLSILNYNKDRRQITNILQAYLHDENIDIDIRRIVLCFLYDTRFSKASECQTIIDGDSKWLEISNYYESNKFFFTHALLLAQATNKPVDYRNMLYHRLSENQDLIISQHPLNTSVVKDLQEKAEYLELGHFYEEAQECRKQICIAKSSKEGVLHLNMTFEIHNSCFSHFTTFFSANNNPFNVLACEDNLLPEESIQLTTESVQSEILGNDCEQEKLPEGIRHLKTDINGNIHENCESISDQLQLYIYRYKGNVLVPMLYTLHLLVENKSFSYRSLKKYLQSTWLAKSRVQVNPDLQVSQESWLDIITPSLKILCSEMRREYAHSGYKGDYVCSLDSLILKIEGCIRDIARVHGLKTTYDNGNEILLNGLLDQMNEVMPRKTILLLKSALTTDGLNLRNNYAHGFSSLADYNLNNAFILLHCLLKISNIQI